MHCGFERNLIHMGWEMPWYSVQDSVAALLAGRRVNRMYLVSYLRQGGVAFGLATTIPRRRLEYADERAPHGAMVSREGRAL